MRLAYKQYGQGQPVILLHAFPFSRKMWEPQIEYFENKDFRLILPDLPGFGETPTTDLTNTMELMAKDVYDLLNHLEITKTCLGGISMGGYVALNFFRLFPEKVNSLILCDTTSTADTVQTKKNRFNLIEEINKNGLKAISDQILDKLLSQYTFQNKKELVDEVRSEILKADKFGTISALKGMAERVDHTSILSNINVPTLLIFGEDDEITTIETAKTLNQNIPNSQLKILVRSGHLSNLENPKEFNNTILNFLKSIEL